MLPNDLKCQARNTKTEENQLFLSKEQNKTIYLKIM